MSKCLALVEIDDLRKKVKKIKFISLSLDEVTTIDNTTWICMHVYTFDAHLR